MSPTPTSTLPINCHASCFTFLCFHRVTNCPFSISFLLIFIHLMGGMGGAAFLQRSDVQTFRRCDASPSYPLSFHTLAHSFALIKITSLLFSIDSALFAQNTLGWGWGHCYSRALRTKGTIRCASCGPSGRSYGGSTSCRSLRSVRNPASP